MIGKTKVNIHSIRIKATGYIKGLAIVTLMLNGQPYKTEEVSDKFNFSWNSDWHTDEATIIFTPIKDNVNKGNLVINYTFIGL